MVQYRFVTQVEYEVGLVASDQLNEAGFGVTGLDRNP